MQINALGSRTRTITCGPNWHKASLNACCKLRRGDSGGNIFHSCKNGTADRLWNSCNTMQHEQLCRCMADMSKSILWGPVFFWLSTGHRRSSTGCTSWRAATQTSGRGASWPGGSSISTCSSRTRIPRTRIRRSATQRTRQESDTGSESRRTMSRLCSLSQR